MTLVNQPKLVLLSHEQQPEFAKVIATQEKMQKSLVGCGLDSSIDVRYQLKPKFSLYPTQKQNFLSANYNGVNRPVFVTDKSICRGVSLYIPVYNRADYLVMLFLCV